MKEILPGYDDYRPAGILGATHTLLMALESFDTQEGFNTSEHDWHGNIRQIKQESKRESECRRAKDAERVLMAQQQKLPGRSLPVPGLVATFQQSCSGILGARNHS